MCSAQARATRTDRGTEAANLPEGLQQPASPQGWQPSSNIQDQAIIPLWEPAVPAWHLQGSLSLSVSEPHSSGNLHYQQWWWVDWLSSSFLASEEECDRGPCLLHVQPVHQVRLGGLCWAILSQTVFWWRGGGRTCLWCSQGSSETCPGLGREHSPGSTKEQERSLRIRQCVWSLEKSLLLTFWHWQDLYEMYYKIYMEISQNSRPVKSVYAPITWEITSWSATLDIIQQFSFLL